MSGIQDSHRADSFTFAAAVSGFLTCTGLPFVDILSEKRIQRVFAKHGCLFGRTYSTAIVLWAFMSQVLRDGKEASCQSAVARISSYLTCHGLGDVDPDTRDYCRARAKLSQAALRELSGEIASESERLVEQEHLFKGRHAKLIDGSTCMMADTPANQLAYPQNPAQKPGIGFPIARFVVVLSLATACVIDAAMGKYKGKGTGETALLRQILNAFEPGDVAVADRFYGNYWVIAALVAKRVDVCFRKHQARPTNFRKGKRFGKDDHLVRWKKPPRPEWMTPEEYEQMPDELELREIRYVITEPGRKQQPFVVITTLDSVQGDDAVSRQDIADLFGFRWNAELDIRSIKTHMNLNHLRCKSPAMVHREYWTSMLAYNAIRTACLSSAWMSGQSPRRISFVSCCQYVLAAWDILVGEQLQGAKRRRYCIGRLEQIGKCLVGNRPGRIEPRVRKKRGTNYNLMMEPRKVLQAKLAKGDNSFETK